MLKAEMDRVKHLIANQVNRLLNSNDLKTLIRNIAKEEIAKAKPVSYPAKAETRAETKAKTTTKKEKD